MPWACVAAAACSVIAASQRPQSADPYQPTEPEKTDCDSCGAPLRAYAMQCDYCKRIKEPSMFNWFKRPAKETPLQLQQRLAAERLQKRILSRGTPLRPSYSAPSPAPAPASSGFDMYSASMGYMLGSSSHSPAPAPEPERFSSGGGGNYGGGGASGSWDSSSSCSSSDSSSSSSSYDSGSSSSDSGSSCSSSD